MATSLRTTSRCRRCGERIEWVRDPLSRYIPLNPHPVPGGEHDVDWSLGVSTPAPADPAVADDSVLPRFYTEHRRVCRNITVRRTSGPGTAAAVCGRHLWRPPNLVVCTAPPHEGACP